jgi:uncharacterized protein YndB with AHSA1/START domain
MARSTITLQRRIEAPPSQVFHAFTNATALREWLCDAAMVVPHPGGRIHLWWANGYHATGDFTKMAPNKKVSFTWRGKGEPRATKVRVRITPDGDGSLIEVAHRDVGTGKKWRDASDSIEYGWRVGLENLESVLETGHDLRFTRRPMLGILPDVLTPDTAARLGVPASRGILLGGVVDGMGAAAAGLREGDVVVAVGGVETPDWAGLQTALSGLVAGDSVDVVFFRGGEQESTTMTLSARPIEEPPATAGALAASLRATGEDFLDRLTATLEGVSDEQAARRPAEGEWSPMEVLCHLVLSERYNHHHITQLVGGFEDWTDDWPGNLDIAHAGLLAVHTTVWGLVEELRRSRAETWAMLAALPDEFVARKGSYWRLAYGLTESRIHDDGHLAQIREALAATG